MLSCLEKVAALEDPVGRVLEGHTRPTGLVVQKISAVPIGVVALIYKSRPNVTTDAASVCLKSGNAVILQDGSESLATNKVLARAMIKALQETGLPGDAVQLFEHKGHESVNELLKLEDYVDVIIPRGGKGLIKRISQGTNIPVIKHYEGICHLYLAADAPPAPRLGSRCGCQFQVSEYRSL
jgi:glutamate-5-semialdehyde dehydrogenase